MISLICTVRGCGAPLLSRDARLVCAAGHAFDRARSGYVNLLQPQDSRARAPGDPPAVVAARRRLLDAGAGAALLEALAETIAGLGLPRGSAAADIGAGEGHYLGSLAARFGLDGVGIELSARAADLAARRYPAVLWLVANADRGLPLAEGSADLILSVDARRNPVECARILGTGGRLIVAVPAPDDLAELRAAALGDAAPEDRAAQVLAEHGGHFTAEARRVARARRHLSGALLDDLLVSTYRGGRAGRRERAAKIAELDVTLSHDILVLRRA
ncbi:MAG TPA: methyltransferase domain-containing protein [Candidatus Methanoperedens sp.]|nr:methyltransferase domain-containing protein [Candidatus Methanoperedens sp.]